jgi:hypothetical protein
MTVYVFWKLVIFGTRVTDGKYAHLQIRQFWHVFIFAYILKDDNKILKCVAEEEVRRLGELCISQPNPEIEDHGELVLHQKLYNRFM